MAELTHEWIFAKQKRVRFHVMVGRDSTYYCWEGVTEKILPNK